jgi:hypothetical protein
MNTNTTDIKNYLYKMIVETDDIEILNKVQTFFIALKDKDIDWWDTISDWEKNVINTGIGQFKNGQGIPHKEVKNKVDKLLGRK